MDDPLDPTLPLSGVRILDISTVIMGPYATQILGDLGAEVIVLESVTGDPVRRIGAGPVPGLSGVALNVYRNKRSVAIDLKHPEGRAVALRLAATTDAVVTNLRPAPLERLGLTYATVRESNPSIVFCHAHGWASGHERANDPAYDDVIQAASGVPDLMERVTGEPYLLPTVAADKVSGLTIAYSVCAALTAAARHGRGAEIEISMTDAMRSFMLVEHGSGSIAEPPQTGAGYPRILTSQRRPKAAADGLVFVMPYTEAHWRAVLAEGDRGDLATDDRLGTAARRHESSHLLYASLHEMLPDWTVLDWLSFCAEHDIPCTEVGRLDDLVGTLPVEDHPVAGPYRHIPAAARFEGSTAPRAPAPHLGRDTGPVLAAAGFSAREIDELRGAGAVFYPEDLPAD